MDTTPRYRLGLVLSGGGARGFAHIGVVQAMYEAGLRPDIISGTSAGSIVGAMIAAGHTPEECLNFFLGKKILLCPSHHVEERDHDYERYGRTVGRISACQDF